ncbi:MAG: glycosyltransferase family 4 protein [Sedimentisphaerales bacterium]|nr:glycosyltransferase family 4 protein [Sedimentisphaerales bacterium]
MAKILLLYHYFHPDTNVSARLYSDLACDLRRRGWEVVVMPSNRVWENDKISLPRHESWREITIRRIWRPPLRQASIPGRMVNAVWLIIAWSLVALRKKTLPDIDIVLLGTDPIFSVLVALPWKWFRPKTRIVHWCFDLYPEAAVADGMLCSASWIVRAVKKMLKPAYHACDLVIDLGNCMGQRLQEYRSGEQRATITPWALVEPAEIKSKFCPGLSAKDKLTILYSGSFGRAHSFDTILTLARCLRNEPIRFVFGVFGNRVDQFHQATGPDDTNIEFIPFVSPDRLQDRLQSGDIHLVSLREEWTGMVMPSKFFAALAVGRPVIFAGSENSAPAEWIIKHKLGWILSPDSIEWVADQLRGLTREPGRLEQIQENCRRVYRMHFSRKIMENQWVRHLQKLTELKS